jgi:hypothetical protein
VVANVKGSSGNQSEPATLTSGHLKAVPGIGGESVLRVDGNGGALMSAEVPLPFQQP